MREGPIVATSEMQLRALRTFGLESILLVVTLVAVILGVAAWAPGLGIALGVVSTPALMRAIGIRVRKKARGEMMTAGEKILAFTSSLGIVLTILLAFLVMFFVVCFSTGVVATSLNSMGLLILGLILGIGSSLYVSYRFARVLWREPE